MLRRARRRIRIFLGGFGSIFSARFAATSRVTPEECPGRCIEEHNSSDPTLRQLWETSGLSAQDFADEIAAFGGFPRVTLPELAQASPLTGHFSRRFLYESEIFPFESETGQFKLAVADPCDATTRRAAELVLGRQVAIEVASFEDIAAVLSERMGREDEAEPAASEREQSNRDDSIDGLRDLASGAPVVRAVNDLLEKALELRASDIHIEPFRSGLTVRMRIDGLLRNVSAPAQAPPRALISRIKILAGLNLAESRLPQDGAARLHIAHSDIDIRVATMPTQHGESAVIRLLPRDRGLLDISKLGLSQSDGIRVKKVLELPHGMVIITGPTGSGKTTTLATLLSTLNTPIRKILTIEDPIEYDLPGINQSQVKPLDRIDVRRGNACLCSARSGRYHGRRNSRRGNREYRHSCGADWPSRLDDSAYQIGDGGDPSSSRSRSRSFRYC